MPPRQDLEVELSGRVDIYHHMVLDGTSVAKLNTILATLNRIEAKQETLMANTQDVLAALATANAQLDTALTGLDGIQGDINDLKALIAAGGTPQEIADAVNALGAKTAAVTAKVTDIDAQTPPPTA